MPPKKIDFSKGALTKEEIEALDDTGAGFYENRIPSRLLIKQDETDLTKKLETTQTPISGPRVEGE